MKKFLSSPFFWITLLLSVGLGVLIRLYVLPKTNKDLFDAFLPWYNHLAQSGLAGLEGSFASYNPPYLILLWIATQLPLEPIFAIKAMSILFDLVCAAAAAGIAAHSGPGWKRPVAAFSLVWLLPTVWVDSAYWGQCDAVYTAFLLLCLLAVLNQKPRLALGWFGAALAFKAQAMLLAPLLLILLLRGQLRWRDLWLPPVVYAALLLPAVLAGRPIADLFTVYGAQTGAFRDLSMNAPNLYLLIPNTYYDLAVPIGLGVTAVCASLLLWLGWRTRRQAWSDATVVLLAALVTTMLPWLLPKMHDRYFYVSALLIPLAAFWLPRLRLPALAVQAAALLVSTAFLRTRVLPFSEFVGLLTGAAFLMLAAAFLRQVWQPLPAPSQTALEE